MPVWTRAPEVEPLDIADSPLSLGESLLLTGEDTFRNLPEWGLLPRAIELDLARTRYAWTQKKYDFDQARSYVENEHKLPADWLENKQYNKLELDILSRRKRVELGVQERRARDPGGFLRGSANLATSVAVSMLSPTMVASAFIPVIREERYSALLARQTGALGRAGIRVGVGAVEGTVGSIPIEALSYGVHQQEMADYTMADSLMNIGFGSVFGATLHAGGGAVMDLAVRRRMKEIDSVLAQVDQTQPAAGARTVEKPAEPATVDISELRYIGKQVDEVIAAREAELAKIVDDPEQAAAAQRFDITKTDAEVQAMQRKLDEINRELAEPREKQIRAEVERRKSDPKYMADERKNPNARDIDEYIEARAARQVDRRRRAQAGMAEALRNEIAPKSAEIAAFNRYRGAEGELAAVRHARDSAKTLEDKLASLPESAAAAFHRRIERTLADIVPAAVKIDKLPGEVRDAMMRAAIAQEMADQPFRLDGMMKIDTDRAAAFDQIRRDAESAADPENSPLAPPREYLRSVEETTAATKSDALAQATAELDEAEAMLKDAMDTMGDAEQIPPDLMADIDAAARFSSEVDSMNRIASMLTQCAMRHSG